MEIRVIARGALGGLIAGILGFVFAFFYAEPIVDKAIDYESGRGEILDALRQAAGMTTEPEGPEIFSRTFQSTIGIATGIIGMSVAMGLLVAVAFLVLQERLKLRPRVLAWSIAAFGFLGIFLLPFAKYPSNPPAIGHEFTIQARGALYLCMVGISLALLAGGVYLARRLAKKLDWMRSIAITLVAFLAVFTVATALMPKLGDLAANVSMSDEFGFARAETETPQPITNVLSEPITVDGVTYAPGQIIYPGFDADLLWKFRWYSVLNQALIWLVVALVFGALMERYLAGPTPTAVSAKASDSALV